MDEIRRAIDAVKALALVANEAGSPLYGFTSDDVITGAAGNDMEWKRAA